MSATVTWTRTGISDVVPGCLQIHGRPPLAGGVDVGSVACKCATCIRSKQDAADTGGRQQRRANRLLVCGPSGSGKTAFAHYVATQLEEPLVTATVRDLVSEEGWTDINLRRVFAHARRDGAILLLDQVDWLVWAPFDHRPAHEQKTLDQLYACLDSHPEVVICTTTRAAGLEPGVVRRFPLRMRFDYLTGEQQRAFLGHLLETDTAASEIAAHFSGLAAVAPGDMVAALQQCAGGASPSPEDMLAALAEGQRLKLGVTGTAIGFSA